MTSTDADALELAALRRRAYGPEGDLDAAGEQRMRMLEARLLHAQPSAARPGGDREVVAAGAVSDDPPDAWAEAGALRAARRRRVVTVSCAGVVAGALLVGVGYTLGRGPTHGETYLAEVRVDAGRALTIASAPSFTSRGLDAATLVQYEGVGDATFWSATRHDGLRCLMLAVPIDGIELSSQGGVYQTACAPGGLPPSLDWAVLTGFPSPPELPTGSILRVAIDGDRLRLTAGKATP